LNFFLRIFKFLPPEIAHAISLRSLDLLYKAGLINYFFKVPTDDFFNFVGLKFRNRLGTAAGLDKNGDFIDALGSLGFGFLEIGTVTPLPQNGNPKPRVFRNFKEKSIINRLGFNNKGVDHVLTNLKKTKYGGVIGVNIGANKNSSDDQRINDYLTCLVQIYKYCDYITINISSPNTPQLRDLHSEEDLNKLILEIEKKIKEMDITIPIFLKISPDESNEQIDRITERVNKSLITGIVATNTTINRKTIKNENFKKKEGGLSGAPLFDISNDVISRVRNHSLDIPLIGVGGVNSRNDFNQKIELGADLVQIYSGFVIKGPTIISEILDH
tara:strand:+ start:90 stop:1076 length:987 start_codon:yes stop_codon:yes gene_type:complete